MTRPMPVSYMQGRTTPTTTAVADPTTLSLQQLRDTVAVQQRSIHFMLANSDALSDQIANFAKPVVLPVNTAIPIGIWKSVSPLTGTIGFGNVAGVATVITAPGPFVSDGTATASYAGGITIVRSAPPPTPLP